MKYLLTTFLSIILPCFLYAEGIKQLKPDSTYSTFMTIQPGGGVSSCFGMETCDADHKLYVHIGHPGEKIYMGFSWSSIFVNQLIVRLKFNNSLVYGPVTISVGSPGYITWFRQAYSGPDVLNPSGYNSISYTPAQVGDYEVDFSNPTAPSVGLDKFDVTVIDTTVTPLEATKGRLWARLWAINTSPINVPVDAFKGTMYVYTNDSVVTSVFFNTMQGHVFEVSCTSNGCYPPPVPWDSSCKSTPGNHVYPQYQIFVNDPDSVCYPTGNLGTIDENTITVTPACNGSFSIHYFAGKAGKVKAIFDVNPLPGIQPEDVIIMDSVQTGWNDLFWNGLNGLGQPLAGGTQVILNLTFVNGLTNLPIFDVERQVHGFVITQVRPPGPTIATYWNDTLLAAKGGVRQLTGCYSFDTVGCHRWNGDYNGIGIGSLNTVNTWWYAASSTTNPIILTVQKPPDTPANISGPTTFCRSAVNTYTIVPNPVFGADPNHYEWVLTDDATSTVLLDLQNQGTSLTISFSSYPSGNMHLKVRGWNSTCGYGSYGPGISGEGIQLTVNPGPQITNTVTSFSICSGNAININLQSSLPSTTYSYTATATSGFISGYSGGISNPIQQTLINTGTQVDSVIYRVVPFALSCIGDTVNFYVAVSPGQPVVINISASANPVCANNLVTFTATFSNQGSSPFFQWKVNGIDQSTNNPLFSYIPLNNDLVTCTLTSSNTICTSNNPATSNSITMTVNPNLPVSIFISASSNPFCIGSSVTFTATPTHGGTTPIYQWKVNGLNAGTNNSTYSYNPISGDIVTCVLTSSDLCVTGNPATSNTITMVGNLGLPAGVSITASPNPFCPGTSVTFTATPNNGGTNPVYQWKVNGVNAGTNSSTYSYNPVTGDKVTCVMTSNLACVSGNPALSNEIILSGTLAPIVSFTTCFDTVTTVNAKPIKLKGGIPLNGTYSGPGVSANSFNPATAGIGTKMITYTYTNAALCSASKTKTITVQANPAFTCGNNLIDIRDGKRYPTVQIGSQCWMAVDLNYGIEISSTQHQRDNCISEVYHNPAASSQKPVYQWDEIMRYDDTPGLQGLCPPAWHVPTEAEWNTLFSFYINNGFAGSPLKYSGFSGFNALLSGVNHLNRQWDFNGFATFFWSSTPYGPYKAWAHGLNDYDPSVSVYPSSRANAFSIRCILD